MDKPKLTDYTRKKLINELGIKDQNLSSVLIRLVDPHIDRDQIERSGYFTELGLQFIRELFLIQSTGSAAELGNARKRFILESKEGVYASLYKDYVKPNDSTPVDFTVELPVPDTGLRSAIDLYRQQTIQQVDYLPLPSIQIDTGVSTRLGGAFYQLTYRHYRKQFAEVHAAALSAAAADTFDDAERSVAFQLGQVS